MSKRKPKDERKLSAAEVEARRQNAQHSTGPRTERGKEAVTMNALKHGIYSDPDDGRFGERLYVGMLKLGENPLEYQYLLAGLVESHAPANPAERLLVEDLASLRWQRLRNHRCQSGLLAGAQERFDEASQLDIAGLDHCYNGPEDEARKVGLRNLPPVATKYKEVLEYLDMLMNQVEKRDHTLDAAHLLEYLYGEQPSWRARKILNLYRLFREWKEGDDPEDEEFVALGLVSYLAQEQVEVLREQVQFINERTRLTPARQAAMLAPEGPSWSGILRQLAQLDHEIERKTKLLLLLQKERRAREVEERGSGFGVRGPQNQDRGSGFGLWGSQKREDSGAVCEPRAATPGPRSCESESSVENSESSTLPAATGPDPTGSSAVREGTLQSSGRPAPPHFLEEAPAPPLPDNRRDVPSGADGWLPAAKPPSRAARVARTAEDAAAPSAAASQEGAKPAESARRLQPREKRFGT